MIKTPTLTHTSIGDTVHAENEYACKYHMEATVGYYLLLVNRFENQFENLSGLID